MSDAPIQLIVAAFNDEKGAEAALKELKKAKKEHLIAIKDAAVIRRDKKDKIHIKDVRDVGGGKGSVAGGIFGVGIALLTGGAGIIVAGAAGALVGGLTAKAVDMGLPNERLKQLGAGLKPETSAIVAIIEHTWVADMQAALEEAGAQVMTEALSADIAAQLEAGKDVAYSVIGDESGTSIDRVAGDEHSVEMENITMTEDGVSASVSVVTEEGAAIRQMVLTDEGMAVREAVITEEGIAAAGMIATEEGVVAGALVATVEDEEDASEEDAASDEGEEETA